MVKCQKWLFTGDYLAGNGWTAYLFIGGGWLAVDGRCGAVHAVVSLKPSTLPVFFCRSASVARRWFYLFNDSFFCLFFRLNVAAASQMEAFGRDSLIVNQQEKKLFVCLFVCCYSMAILFFFLRLLRKVRKTRNMTPHRKITGNHSWKNECGGAVGRFGRLDVRLLATRRLCPSLQTLVLVTNSVTSVGSARRRRRS